MQGTKVLEDREVRHRFRVSTEGAPPQDVSTEITKYTGALASPEWEDIEPGRVFSLPWYLVKNSQRQKDKFEVLCSIEADITGAPYTQKLAETGKMGYERSCDVILLVGLTELKRRSVGSTPKPYVHVLFYKYPFTSCDLHICKSRGKRKGL